MPKFKFMWLNYKLEQEYFKAFKLDEDILPTLVFLNPGKKKRFLVHTSAMAQSEIGNYKHSHFLNWFRGHN